MAGNFYLVECPDCENEQTVFGKASTEAVCAVCGHTLAHPTGGTADIEGEILETLEERPANRQEAPGESVEAQ